MYSVLIVDDEYQARSGLRDFFPWADYQIRVVGDVSDGEEALPLLKKLEPDILITDVRMNRMDGISLAKQARDLLPDIVIIFISAYPDSDYLRNALLVEAVDYLYKPIHMDELAKTIEKAVRKLDSSASSRAQQEQMRLLLEKSKPLLTERFLRSWFHGYANDPALIHDRLKLLGLVFPMNTSVIACFFQPDWKFIPTVQETEACQLLLEKIIHSVFDCVLTCAEDTGVLALFPTDRDGSFRNHLDLVRDRIQAETRARLLIGISQAHQDLTEVPDAMKQAQAAVASQIIPADQNIIHYEPEAQNIPWEHAQTELFFPGSLIFSDYRSICLQARQIIQKINQHPRLDNASVRKTLMYLALVLDLSCESRESAPDIHKFCQHAMGKTPVTTLCSQLLDYIERTENEKSLRYSPAVTNVLEIIRKRYMEHLDIEFIAESVHYSPAHLSTLFRKETGVTIGEALLEERMKQAAARLLSSPDPVSRIAQETGYPDIQYFSKVFKRYTGLTPLEYRKRGNYVQESQ